ncbi:hypothetical protein LIER_39269 [Lithospermum erythrorhizon]|uniref:CCHC-type domain-containing protein n=1 Tax=Lithospermum erythrorhizon TaxID=34254 RepID=A0AAV3QHM7_LITER
MATTITTPKNSLCSALENASHQEKGSHRKHKSDVVDVQCLMLANMEPSFQIQYEKVAAYDIYRQLEELFRKEARNERYDTVCALVDSKLGNGQAASPHIIKMIGLVDRLNALGTSVSKELAVDLILKSLPDKFSQFVMNFNMHKFELSLNELHKMITNAETNLGKTKTSTPSVLVVQNKKKFKKKKKFTGKAKGSSNPKAAGQGSTRKDDKCHYCGNLGHWKSTCMKFTDDRKNGLTTT